MGDGLYRRMGFVELYRYEEFLVLARRDRLHAMSDAPNPDGSSPRTHQVRGAAADGDRSVEAVHRGDGDVAGHRITIALDAAAAPKTVNNFVFLAR